MVDQTRRRLLRAAPPSVAPLRPPWSLPEAQFTNQCSRCGDCVNACETQIIIQGDGGYPQLDFSRGECTFCAQCVDKCPTDALSLASLPPMRIRAQLVASCLTRNAIACRSCEDSCEHDAIRFIPVIGGPAQAQINAAQCNGCGACVSRCPVGAISMQPMQAVGD